MIDKTLPSEASCSRPVLRKTSRVMHMQTIVLWEEIALPRWIWSGSELGTGSGSGWLPKFSVHFLVQRYICDEVYMKFSVIFFQRCEPCLSVLKNPSKKILTSRSVCRWLPKFRFFLLRRYICDKNVHEDLWSVVAERQTEIQTHGRWNITSFVELRAIAIGPSIPHYVSDESCDYQTVLNIRL